MTTYVTKNRQVTDLSRENDIYVLTDYDNNLNEQGLLGFYNFYTDYDAATHAAKKMIDNGYGRTKITTITPNDDILYTGGAIRRIAQNWHFDGADRAYRGLDEQSNITFDVAPAN